MPKYKIKGRTVNLTNRDFLSQGGEGSVYAQGNRAYKIYTDPAKMIPLGKIQELVGITDNKVIKPEQAVYNSHNKPVGYTMQFVRKTTALCQLFTRSFKEQHKIDVSDVVELVKGMRQTIDHIHQQNILIVDLNEMNFLVDRKFSEVYFIDVDSYQTPSYPATALMESVRDRHSPPGVFNKGTDWLAFAIVTFQLFIGIHPYKGKHPKYKGFDDRMSRNLSVFSSDVTIPKNCYSFDIIPRNLRAWYEKVFQDTLRIPPPLDLDASVPILVQVQVISGSDNFEVKEMASYAGEKILYYLNVHGAECIVTDKKVYAHGVGIDYNEIPAVGVYGGIPHMVWLEDEKVKIKELLTRKEIPNTLSADSLMTCEGRVYLKSDGSVLELFINSNNAMIAEVASILPKATKLYPGVAVQNMLGLWVINTFGESGASPQHRLVDLKNYKIVDAKYDSGILMIIGTKKGQYDRFIYLITDSSIKFVRKVEDITFTGLNFVVLDTGVCVMINEQEAVEAFSRKYPDKVKIIDDDTISGSMRLFKKGGKVIFGKGEKLCVLKMK